jgi:hypothetical protein
MNGEANENLQLDYLGKAHDALKETGQRVHATIVIQSITSLLTISLVLRVVQTDSQYQAAGLTLHADSAFFLVALSVASAALLSYLIGLMQHESDLRDLIVNMYRESGFQHRSLEVKLLNPLEYPHIITVIRSVAQRPALPHPAAVAVRWITRLAILGLMLALPIAAQMFAGWGLNTSGQTWLAAACAMAALLPLAYLYIFVKTP